MIIYAQLTPAPERAVHSRKVRHIRDLRRLLATAVFDGAEQLSPTSWKWDLAARCEEPRNFVLEGRYVELFATDKWGAQPRMSQWSANARPDVSSDTPPLFVEMATRCRKCSWCLKQRASLWSARARQEIHHAARTWFGTLTLRPEEHFRTLCVAETRALARGTAWAELSPAEQFRARHAVISEELTKWLKRIRKESGARVRYCLVAEAHKSGLPHYHILIHERWLGGTTGERTLRRQWKLGHSKFNLVENAGAAWYVAKYLAKASAARVRASARYGTVGL